MNNELMQEEKDGFFKRRWLEFKESPIEFICMLLCVAIIVAYNFCVDSEHKNEFMGNAINLFCTFVFSWLFAKYSCNLEAKRENKRFATVAYRHNKSLLTKIDYNICLIDSLIENKTNCRKESFSCEQRENLFRIRDAMISFKRDSQENLADWTSQIADEIDLMNECIKKYDDYKNALEDSQDENNDVGEANPEEVRIEYKKLREKLPKEFRIILDNEIKLTDEMDAYLNKEEKLQAQQLKEMIEQEAINDIIDQVQSLG